MQREGPLRDAGVRCLATALCRKKHAKRSSCTSANQMSTPTSSSSPDENTCFGDTWIGSPGPCEVYECADGIHVPHRSSPPHRSPANQNRRLEEKKKQRPADIRKVGRNRSSWRWRRPVSIFGHVNARRGLPPTATLRQSPSLAVSRGRLDASSHSSEHMSFWLSVEFRCLPSVHGDPSRDSVTCGDYSFTCGNLLK